VDVVVGPRRLLEKKKRDQRPLCELLARSATHSGGGGTVHRVRQDAAEETASDGGRQRHRMLHVLVRQDRGGGPWVDGARQPVCATSDSAYTPIPQGWISTLRGSTTSTALACS
jgi:hypothetical protein